MNDSDREELIRLAKENIKLQRMLSRHEDYKERIRLIRKRGFLTPVEQQEMQDLKFKKLRGKEQMMWMMRSLRTESLRSEEPRKNGSLNKRARKEQATSASSMQHAAVY